MIFDKNEKTKEIFHELSITYMHSVVSTMGVCSVYRYLPCCCILAKTHKIELLKRMEFGESEQIKLLGQECITLDP